MQQRGLNIFRLFVGFVACANWSVFDALAQSYPVKPIRVVVGTVAGGATDVTARMVAQKLSEHLGQSVIVENRPGASGAIAGQRVATATADGYTLLMIAAAEAVQPALRNDLPYDMERDLAPVSLVTIGPYVIVVHPAVPARNAKELIALARAQPGKITYGTAGIGSSTHLAVELFNLMAKVKTVHVPYKGSAQAAVATATGQVEMSFPNIAAALPLLDADKLRSIAVSSMKRASLMPSIPTLNESGLPGYDRSGWYGMLATAGVPGGIIARLNTAVVKAVNTPEMKESFSKQGLDVQTNTPQQFATFIRNELAQNARLVKLTGAKAE